jgi:hypothetical protein
MSRQVDVLEGGDVVAHDDSHMGRRGSRRNVETDTNGDGEFDERDVRFR